MKVLLPLSHDQVFPREQAESLAVHCEVETSFEAFWENRGQFDIVQLNWPEELTQWREPTDIELIFLRCVLQRWGRTSRIVLTRHNVHPHYSDTERYRNLYEIVHSSAHAVVHMGDFSLRDYCQRYASMEFLQEQIQEVIPHPVFSSYSDTKEREAARKFLGLKPDTFVFLVFGRIRSAIEKNLVVDAFLKIPVRDKVAIVPGWKTAAGKEPVNRIKWAQLRASGRFKYENRFVPDDEVGTLFRAADLALIPRVDVLNSGLVFLCIKFDCPMVAPACGNVTELAEKMGAPLFQPESRASLYNVLDQAVSKVFERPDFSRLRRLLRPELIAEKYAGLYGRIIKAQKTAIM